MKLKWQQAPVKTQWGDEMVVASVAIDNDHTLSLYCERDQTDKVEAMFSQRLHGLNQELVEALKWIADQTYDPWTNGAEAQRHAQAALAKATGEQA